MVGQFFFFLCFLIQVESNSELKGSASSKAAPKSEEGKGNIKAAPKKSGRKKAGAEFKATLDQLRISENEREFLSFGIPCPSERVFVTPPKENKNCSFYFGCSCDDICDSVRVFSTV